MIALRPYAASDVTFVREHVFGEHAGELQWFGFSAPHLQADFEATGLLTADGGRLIVEEHGRAVGSVQWFKDNWGPSATSWCWEIGIALCPESRGRGVGTQAQVLLRDYLLDHTRADRIQAVTDVENVVEQRALERAGFTHEGVVRGAQWRAGQWHDQMLYSFLRSDR